MENKDISKDSIVRYFEPKNKNLLKNYEIDLHVALLEEGDYFEVFKG